MKNSLLVKSYLLAALVGINYSCNDNARPQQGEGNKKEASADYLIFGHYYGMCPPGEETCVEIFKLSENTLLEDTADKYPGNAAPYQGNFTEDKSEKYNEVKELLEAIPNELITTSSGNIGCPDCTDGGGIYVEIRLNNEVKYWSIDKQRVPDYLADFVSKIEQKIKLLQ